MICEQCNNCQSYGMDKDFHKVTCKTQGKLVIHDTNAERFRCGEYAEYVEPELPPKDNVMIVLFGSGRDFMLRDKDISNHEDLLQLIARYNEYVEIGGMIFRTRDIAAFTYIGD